MKRLTLIVIGWLMVVIGVIGAFLPLLPTTPFLLLAAYCFSKSSPRFHHWLIHHKTWGPPVVAWQRHGVIRSKHKVISTVVIAITFFFSYGRVKDKPVALYGMSSTLAGSLLFIWSRPSKPKGESAGSPNQITG